MIKCNCNSTNVHMVDHEPLSMDKEFLKDSDQQFDNELYGKFECEDCGETFPVTLKVTE